MFMIKNHDAFRIAAVTKDDKHYGLVFFMDYTHLTDEQKAAIAKDEPEVIQQGSTFVEAQHLKTEDITEILISQRRAYGEDVKLVGHMTKRDLVEQEGRHWYRSQARRLLEKFGRAPLKIYVRYDAEGFPNAIFVGTTRAFQKNVLVKGSWCRATDQEIVGLINSWNDLFKHFAPTQNLVA